MSEKDRCKIRLLRAEVVNKIAAGEVVEDPSCVVKELVENSLDASATVVSVEIEKAGLGLVAVTDDGVGMTQEEALLALERHATSKIERAEDLLDIRTLGFRGEALPSIASVSRFLLRSRARGDPHGVEVRVEGGQKRGRPCSMPFGTRIEVRDLFQNTPARLKFQRGERARLASIREVLERVALSRPDIHFVLRVEGRKVCDWPRVAGDIERVAQVYGMTELRDLVKVSFDGRGVEVRGTIGAPRHGRRTPRRTVLTVLGRPFEDPGLRKLVATAFQPLLEEGYYPLAVLHLSVPSGFVDVNVHPRKIQVRFKDRRLLHDTVFQAVAATVNASGWIDLGRGVPGGMAEARHQVGSGIREGRGSQATSGTEKHGSPAGPMLLGHGDRWRSMPAGRYSSLRFVGQVARCVLVLEGKDSLVLVDQHAAHERVLFDRLWRSVAGGEAAQQPLLVPEVVDLRHAGMPGDPDEFLSILRKVGFDVDMYGETSVVVRAVPVVLRGRGASEAIRGCAEALEAEGGVDPHALLKKIVATVACHAAVRAGDPMGFSDVQALLAQMDRVDMASYCPHGRQAVVSYPLKQVLGWFGRK